MLIFLGVIVLCVAAYYMFRGWFLILRSLLRGKGWNEELMEWLEEQEKRLKGKL